MIELLHGELEKLSAITGVSVTDISRLYEMRLLNPSVCLNTLIAYDYSRLKRRGHYTASQIREALAAKYNVTASKVTTAAYYKNCKKVRAKKRQKYCSNCGKPITGREYKRGNTKCDKCVGASIVV